MPAAWRKYRNYIFVIPLCAAALFYQVTYSVVVIRDTLKGFSLPDSPFLTVDGTVTLPSDEAAKAGIHVGDRVVSVDGKSLNSEGLLYQEVDRHSPGDLLSIGEIPHGQIVVRTLKVPVDRRRHWSLTVGEIAAKFALLLVLLLCVLTGIYMAIRSPGDKRALIAASLLLSLSQAIKLTDWYGFPQWAWLFANLWSLAWTLSWSAVIAAFGLYFPERFAWDKKRPWLKWLYLGPVLCLDAFVAFALVVPEFSFREYDALTSGRAALIASPAIMLALSIGLFFGCIGVKQGKAKNPDVSRRLRLLEAGAGVGLGPVGLFIIYSLVITPAQPSETAALIVAVIFLIFPLTLAYAVLTERAMDLRVVIRQGMRYTLARGGLRVLIAIFGLIFFSVLSRVLFRPGVSDATKAIAYILATLAFIFLVRRARSQMFVFIDKKFFRDHYNAELLLGDLTENVRAMVDERELLQSVSRQISDALHVSHFSVLMKSAAGFRPVYSLGLAVPEDVELPESSKAVALLAGSKEPAPIYFDRFDNWIHDAPPEELVILKALGVQLLLPLKAKEKLLGLFCLGPKLSEEPFSKNDINLLRSVALQTGLALDNSRLTLAFSQEVAQRERHNREIEIAREVQERLFPQHLPIVAGIDYFGSCRPALGVGGDYYDFLSLANGDLGVAIGDVSGKGIAAALLMASLQASLRGQALAGLNDLAQLVSNVNRLVYEATPVNRYATFFYGQYNKHTRVFRYVNAGHNPPFVLRETNNGAAHVIRLDTGGPVIGLFPEAPYQQGSLTLHPGDIFVGFTDGISEAMNPVEEEWGEEQLIHAAASHAARGAAEIIPSLMADADCFVNGAPQHDDMTLIVLKLQPETAVAAGG